jgi:hypothetical protein
MAKVRSTARIGAVSITDKHGNKTRMATIGTEIPMAKIAWMVRTGRLYGTHEHDFAPLYDGCKTLVCSCGAVQDDGEVC